MHPDQAPILSSHYDLDLRLLSDEPLVVLFKECGYAPARNELLRRYERAGHRLIRRLTVQWELQEADRQDLEQESILWVVEAIRSYRTEEYVRTNGCQFRSFLHRVVQARLIDAVRERCRRTRRIRLHPQLPWPWNEKPQDLAITEERPDQEAEDHEIHDRLEHEISRLTPPARALWALLVEGVPLHDIAETLKVSYDTAKRRRRQLIAGLQTTMGRVGSPESQAFSGICPASS
jgi:RNA polymerase sigma factor (sigma-70 family)